MTTWTIRKDGGGDYTTMDSALSNASTVDNDTVQVTQWSGSGDSADAEVVDDNITIDVLESVQNSYSLDVSNGQHALTISGSGTTIKRLRVIQSGTGTSDECVRIASGGAQDFEDCYFRTNGSSDQDCVYYSVNSSCQHNFTNCQFLEAGRAGIHYQLMSGGTITIECEVNSCTFYDCDDDASDELGGAISYDRSDGSISYEFYIYNSIFADCSTNPLVYEDATPNSDDSWYVHRCLFTDDPLAAPVGSKDGTPTFDEDEGNTKGGISTTDTDPPAANTIAFEDITSSPPDLHLIDHANNEAVEYHSDGVGPPTTGSRFNIPSADYDGESRVTDYDVGAFVVPAGGPAQSPVPIIMQMH